MENLEMLLEQANSGDAKAQYKLGRAYETGDGVNADLSTAKMWYQKSADNGYKNAEMKLRLLPGQAEPAPTEAESPAAPAGAYVPPAAPKTTYTPPTAPKSSTSIAQPVAKVGQKSKVVAALLALFLGGFGVHDFYLGYKKQGIIKLILTITVVASFVAYIWTLIDLIKILCNGKLDSNGQLLK